MSEIAREKSERVRGIATAALFGAVILLLAFTPIGFIHLGVIKATIVHVPVIIASVVLGPRMGALMGGVFGLTSLINNTMTPALLSFAFSPLIPVPGLDRGSIWALVVCFGPRILVGVFPYYVDRAIAGFRPGNAKIRAASLFSAGVAGAMTNTLLVMHLIYFLFRDAYANATHKGIEAVYGVILGIIASHGIPEALVAGVCTAAVAGALLRLRRSES